MSNKTKSLYPLPDIVDPPERLCVVVHVPNDDWHRRAFQGAVLSLTHWYSWQRDDEHKGKDVAAVWSEIYDEMMECFYMPCCCTNPLELQQRLLADGTMQVSSDGGATWTDAAVTEDPRTAGSYAPPVDASDAEGKCSAANAAVAWFKQKQAETHGQMADGVSASVLGTALIAFLVGIGVIATGGALAILMAGLGSVLVGLDAADWNALFTDDLWADLLCLIYCTMDTSGAISEADALDIGAQIYAAHPDRAGQFIKNLLTGMGQVGLTNAIRSGLDGALSCDDCDCGLDLVALQLPGQVTDCTVVFQSEGVWRLTLGTRDAEGHTFSLGGVKASDHRCFKITAVDLIVGNYTRSYRVLCGGGEGFGAFIDVCITDLVIDRFEATPEIETVIIDLHAEVC